MWKPLILALALLGSLAAAPVSQPTTAPPMAPSPPTAAAVVSMVGEVNDYTRDLLIRQFAQARRAGAKTVIVHIDTFGGMVPSALEIAQFIRGQSDLHTIAYVDKAISAGAMISVSCDEIVMAPSAVIGDCAPIIFTPENTLHDLQPTERAKEASPVLADFDASADRNGYDRKLLEAMVVIDRVLYYVENPATHERRFVDEKEYPTLSGHGWRDVPKLVQPINPADRLLTVHTNEAVALGLARGVAASPEALASQRGFAIVAFLSNPFVRGLAMLVLTISLWTFLGAPGHGLAEAMAILSLGVLVGVPLLTGYAQWWELLVILGGLGLLAFEVFVFPGHGVSAALGLLMLLGGLLLTFVGQDGVGPSLFPQTPQGWSNLRHGSAIMAGSLAGAVVVGVLLRPFLPRLPYFNRLILKTVSGNDPPLRHSADTRLDDAWPGVGTAGVAVTDLRPGGSAAFHDLATGFDRTVGVVSETGYVTAGAKLVVREARGNRVVVRPLPVTV
jgi:membrane-bound serine protease (ClpP class)